MKVIQKILFLFLFISSFTACAQSGFPIPQNLGSKVTKIRVSGLLVTDTGFVLKGYVDTTAANTAQLRFNGSLIKVDTSLYLFNVNKWFKIENKNVVIDTLPLSIRINNNTTAINANTAAINVNTIAISTKQAILVNGQTIKTINGIPIIGSGNITINAGSGSQNLQSVTNIDSNTTTKITARTYRATLPSLYANNAAAIAGGLQDGDMYRLPYNNGVYLVAFVVIDNIPPTALLNENGTPLLNENGTILTAE